MTIGRVQPGTRTQFWVKKKKKRNTDKEKERKEKKRELYAYFRVRQILTFSPPYNRRRFSDACLTFAKHCRTFRYCITRKKKHTHTNQT